LPSITYKTPLNHIRLGEFDLGGVLYHANYFHLLEEIRESFLRSIDLPYSELANIGTHLTVINSELNFHKPIRYGDQLDAEMIVDMIGKTRLKFTYIINNSTENSKIFSGSTTHTAVVIDSETKSFKVSKVPEELESKLK
jgi:YbgC/YbaW family acyl-CoA thioester hydrolase